MKALIMVILYSAASLSFDHSHSVFDKILKSNVVWNKKQSLVKYSNIDKEQLKKYVDSLSALSPTDYQKFSEKQKIAFLVNAYNGFTLMAIVENLRVKSIKDITKIWGVKKSWIGNVWGISFFTLLGKKRNLDWIEHEKLRKDFKEPRIHAAVNCASLGCPSLYAGAFVADALDSQLDKSMSNFINNSQKNYFDKGNKELKISKIFSWFSKDFKEVGVKNFVLKYMNVSDEHKRLILSDDVDIEYTNYDWNLNKAP